VRVWLSKLRLKLLHSFARAIEIKPFLEIDPRAYCPCCGHRDPASRIRAVALKDPDQAGSKIAAKHSCGCCSFEWLENSVSIIQHHILEQALDEEQAAFDEMNRDKRTKNVKSQIKVNNSVVA